MFYCHIPMTSHLLEVGYVQGNIYREKPYLDITEMELKHARWVWRDHMLTAHNALSWTSALGCVCLLTHPTLCI